MKQVLGSVMSSELQKAVKIPEKSREYLRKFLSKELARFTHRDKSIGLEIG